MEPSLKKKNIKKNHLDFLGFVKLFQDEHGGKVKWQGVVCFSHTFPLFGLEGMKNDSERNPALENERHSQVERGLQKKKPLKINSHLIEPFRKTNGKNIKKKKTDHSWSRPTLKWLKRNLLHRNRRTYNTLETNEVF